MSVIQTEHHNSVSSDHESRHAKTGTHIQAEIQVEISLNLIIHGTLYPTSEKTNKKNVVQLIMQE